MAALCPPYALSVPASISLIQHTVGTLRMGTVTLNGMAPLQVPASGWKDPVRPQRPSPGGCSQGFPVLLTQLRCGRPPPPHSRVTASRAACHHARNAARLSETWVRASRGDSCLRAEAASAADGARTGTACLCFAFTLKRVRITPLPFHEGDVLMERLLALLGRPWGGGAWSPKDLARGIGEPREVGGR